MPVLEDKPRPRYRMGIWLYRIEYIISCELLHS